MCVLLPLAVSVEGNGITVHDIVKSLTVEKVPAARKPSLGNVNRS
jgi:hypothetical protein